MTTDHNALLSIRGLSTQFRTKEGVVRAVDDVSFDIPAGKTVALVGESGCGKSVTAYSILQLIPPPGKIVAGQILFGGEDLVGRTEHGMREIRGNAIAMIFQEPATALNPVFTIGNQIGEALRVHRGLDRRAARTRSIELLEKVRIPAPGTRVDEYPHQLSGGMRQRVMIAMALACEPRLLIADEPTTALDVTIQAQILELLSELQQESGMAILLITHDLGVVAETADEVVIMYAARVVERTNVNELFSNPLHPYTRGLFASLPRLGSSLERLAAIPGTVPNPIGFPQGCRFHPRCADAVDSCRQVEPSLRELATGHFVSCDVLK